MLVPKRTDIERLHDLAEEVIGELPIAVLEVSLVKHEFLFALEHITDGECWLTLPALVTEMPDEAVRTLLEHEVEILLDMLWGRLAGPIS